MRTASAFMTMRAEVRRNEAGKTPYGGKDRPGYVLVADGVPCFVRVVTRRELVDGKVMTGEALVGLFRHDADVLAGDRIEQVKDRRDRVLFAGPLLVDGAPQEHYDGARMSHKEATLRRVRGA